MLGTKIEAGRSYRFQREVEVRDEKTGTLRAIIRKGTVLAVRRIDAEEDHAFLEGLSLPMRLDALARMVDPA